MIYLKLLIYFLSIFIPGYFILLFWKKEMPFLFRLALAYGLGNFIIAVQLFLFYFILQIHVSTFSLLSIFLVEDILLFYFAHKNGCFLRNFKFFKLPKNLKIGEIILILLLVIQLVFIFFNAISRPTITFDSLAMWSFKAKTLYYEKGVDFNPGSAVYLGGGGHINYPWLVPLSQFWLHEVMGEYNDLMTNFIFFFYFVFIIILLYYFIRKYASRFAGLLFAFLFSTTPLIFYHSYNGYADLPLGYYSLIAFVLLFFWIESKEIKYLILSAIFFGITLWIKTEALFFIFSAVLVFSYYLFISKTINNKLKKFFNFLLNILIIISPILFFNFKYNLGVSNIDSGKGFHPEVFKSLFESLFMSGNWNIWWIVFVVIFVFNIKTIIKNKEQLFGWLFLFIVSGEFLAVYFFTNDYQYAVNHTAISRNIITLLPISVFLVGVTYFSDSNLEENKITHE
jgi:hypothetical protein